MEEQVRNRKAGGKGRPELLNAAAHTARTADGKPVSRRALVNYEDLPDWQRDNAYIVSAYRPASHSFRLSAASIFYLHNEFVNIHTHLFGGLLFAAVPLYLALVDPSSVAGISLVPAAVRPDGSGLPWLHPWTGRDAAALGCFFGGAVACLLTSATYHCVSNHSATVAAVGNRLDYAGIVALIAGSFVPSVYYGFYCDVRWQRAYWAMILGLGAACTLVSVTPKFRTPLWRPFRATMFVGMGMSAVFPVLHGLGRHGWADMEHRIGLRWLLAEGVLYVTGAGLYAARIPEKYSPGTFDVWGSSHQIFHVLVVMAACSHLVGLVKAGEYAHMHTICPV